MESRVWIAQAMCPRRHCILAAAAVCLDHVAAAALAEMLRARVDELLAGKQFNSWCALCEARRPSWTFEPKPTPFRTLEEAAPALDFLQASQMATRAYLGGQ